MLGKRDKIKYIIPTKEQKSSASECICQTHFSVICQVLVPGMKNIMKFDAKIDYSETKEEECGTMITCTQRQQSNENPTNYGIMVKFCLLSHSQFCLDDEHVALVFV